MSGIKDTEFRQTPLALGVTPNPFRGSVAVEYYLDRGSTVSGVVYDLLGREVCRLLDTRQGSGLHRVIWDGRTNSGQRAAGGLYMLRIEAGDCVGTSKIVIIR
jgi:hypothetical protein